MPNRLKTTEAALKKEESLCEAHDLICNEVVIVLR